MNENQWDDAVKDAHEAAAEAFNYCVANDEYLDSAAGQDAAHEWADGCAWVIYTAASRGLWMESHYVRGMEEVATSGIDPASDIDEQITLCVYHALRTQFQEAWDAASLKHDESEAAE